MTMNWLQAGVSIATCENSSPIGKSETRILLMYALGLSRIQLITQSETLLDAEQAAQLHDLITRRYDGEPIAYLIGQREFFGLNFHITHDVLIPRPDTELLVELAMQHSPQQGRAIDLGTGSGAIAISLKHQRPDLDVSASDISAAAVQVAQGNADRLLGQGAVNVMQSDWFSAVAQQRFHTIVSNPPYIVKDDHHLAQGDLRFEPIIALTDQGDGLSGYRQIISLAPDYLHTQGWLLMEHGFDQAAAVGDLLRQHGFVNVQNWLDINQIARVSGGQFIAK